MTDQHHARLMASNFNLLQTGKYSDLVVKCGSKEWHVHRSIVCEGSKYFATVCDGAFLVNDFPLDFVALADSRTGIELERSSFARG